MPLQCWCYLLGIIFVTTGLAVSVAPTPLARFYNAMPRNKTAGIILSTIAWIWAGFALWNMGLDIIEPFKKILPVAVLICIPMTWFWLDNLLTCRALGAILVLFPYGLLHVARVHPSAWRLVLVTLAYLCIIKGMTLLLYPWKMRQVIVWVTARPLLFRMAGVLHALLGIGLIVLGALILR